MSQMYWKRLNTSRTNASRLLAMFLQIQGHVNASKLSVFLQATSLSQALLSLASQGPAACNKRHAK